MPLDPTIKFEWPETVPMQHEGDCEPGDYTGMFSCELATADSDLLLGAEVDGPIVLTLSRSQDGEFLEIANGSLNGIAALVFGFKVKLAGRLDYGTNHLSANATEGGYGSGDPDVLGAFGTVNGTLAGMLNRATATLSGQWTLSITEGAGAGISCTGPWSAIRML